jgi:3-oxoacyl-[acyl-carrier protein] reductase
VVVVSGMSSVQVMGHYATSNVIRCAWLAQAKTLAFALGERGIHVNTLSLGGTLTPGYTASLDKRARAAGVGFAQRLRDETSNIPLGKYGARQVLRAAGAGRAVGDRSRLGLGRGDHVLEVLEGLVGAHQQHAALRPPPGY